MILKKVSLISITGMYEPFEKYIANNITKVKEIIANSSISVAVEFGIRTPVVLYYGS
jgi:hypothetical protein